MGKLKIFLVIIGLIAGGYYLVDETGNLDETKRDGEGNIVQSGDVGVLKIKVGDCYNDVPIIAEGEAGKVEKVTGVPCSGSHRWEAYAEKTSSLEIFDEAVLIQEATDFCQGDSASDFIQNLSIDRQNQIASIYEKANVIALWPVNEYTFEQDKVINCLIGSDTEYYTGSIRE